MRGPWGTPKSYMLNHFYRIVHYKPSSYWGFPHLWKPPCQNSRDFVSHFVPPPFWRFLPQNNINSVDSHRDKIYMLRNKTHVQFSSCLVIRLYWTILNYIELYWTILNYIELYWTILNYIELYWTILNYIELYWTILNYIELMTSCKNPQTFYNTLSNMAAMAAMA